MTSSYADGSHHPGRAAERSDRINDRPDHMPDTGHILNQNSPEDTRAAYSRHDASRHNAAADAALPGVQIVNYSHQVPNHTQFSEGLFDRNHDSRVTRAELGDSLRDPRGDRNAIAATLLRNFSEVASLNPRDGNRDISSSDMAELRRLPFENPLAQRINDDMLHIPGSRRLGSLFDRTHGVIPDAVQQSPILRDSTFMAGLTSLATNRRGQEFIMDHIRQDGDVYHVRIGDRTITTDLPTPTETSVYARNSNHGSWPNLFEQAAGIARNGPTMRPQEALENLSPRQVIDTLFANTGTRNHIQVGQETEQNLHSRLSNISSNAMLMIAAPVDRPNAMAERADAAGRRLPPQALRAGQSYAVRYDAATRTVQLRNPQNGGETLRIPLNVFHRNFATFDSVQPPW